MVKNCHVGVKGIIRMEDKCLVLRKKTVDLEYWDIPGGRIEDSESLEEALVRELTEELPSLKRYEIGDVVSAHRLGRDLKDGTGLIFVFFVVRVDDFTVELTSEHSDYLWVTKETVGELRTLGPSIEPKYYDAITRALELG